MRTFEQDMNDALLTCQKGIWQNGEFSRIYSFSTENVSGYIKHFELPNKKLFTVGSSGDQVLNAFYAGARDITLYDINPFAKYYTFLKIAGIMSLSYREFRLFFLKHSERNFYNRHMFSKNTFERIKPQLRVLDYESYLFFDELFSQFKGETIRDRLFDDDESRTKVILGFNNYLHNEESYNNMKQIIKSITFRYIFGDIFEDKILGSYDNIFLSNLSNVKSFEKYKTLLEKLDYNNLNNGGSMLLAYLWNIYFNETYYEKEWFEIYKLPKIKKSLSHFISEAHDIPGARDILWKEKKNRDLALIYRK